MVFGQTLATLIAIGTLDIRLALRTAAFGLYHEKLGLFQDEQGHCVSFLGSANETWAGWHQRGNYEAIEVFCSWRSGAEAERVARHEAYFERLWEGIVPGIEIVCFPEAARYRLVAASLGGFSAVDIEFIKAHPKKRSPLPYQSDAIEAWKQAGQRGIFEHATGSGKTFTAILIIQEHISTGLPALILVPSQLLLEQWAAEIHAELPEATLLLAGAGNDRWRQPGRLTSLTNPSPELGARVVLATMQTAATDDFLRAIQGGNHLLVVADEVHQIGSPFNARALDLASGPRLGLSATPIRYGDPEGTARLFEYFGPVVPPPITLQDAIKAGRLVEYEYFPHPVHLTAEEAEQWRALTRSISLEMARQKADPNRRKPISEKAKMLLIQRARIAKKASSKAHLAGIVLRNSYASGQHWLVYCEDSEQMCEVMAEIRSVGLSPIEYHTGMEGDRALGILWPSDGAPPARNSSS